MAIDEKKPVYAFCQNTKFWYMYSYEYSSFLKIYKLPKLPDNFAGIGTRRLNESGKKVIKELLEHNDKR